MIEDNPPRWLVWSFCIVFFFAVLFIVIGIWIFQSKMEAEAFGRVTGKTVTTWDAMWIDLRVQEPTR